ncbi:MAG: hypothetical protein ACRELY_22425 [Polyangiaceae bacterium]
MNMSLNHYIVGLERSARELPNVLAEWDDIDLDLRDEYVAQLEWLLCARQEILARAQREQRYFEIAQRIVTATSSMFDLREELAAKMAIAVDQMFPFLTYSSTEDPERHFGTAEAI